MQREETRCIEDELLVRIWYILRYAMIFLPTKIAALHSV